MDDKGVNSRKMDSTGIVKTSDSTFTGAQMVIAQDSSLMLKNMKAIDENAKGAIRQKFDPNYSSDEDNSDMSR
jgi:hypothetical protein